MIDYILIEDAHYKIPILAKEDLYYIITVNEYQLTMDSFMERELAYAIHSIHWPVGSFVGQEGKFGHICHVPYSAPQLLRIWMNNLTPRDIDKFIDLFNKDHTIKKVDNYSIKMQPPITEPGEELKLLSSGFEEAIAITHEEEKELLNIAKEKFIDRREEMIEWFMNYCYRYGIDSATNDLKDSCELVFNYFCVIHGISPCLLNTPRPYEWGCELNPKTTLVLASKILVLLMGFSLIVLLWHLISLSYDSEPGINWLGVYNTVLIGPIFTCFILFHMFNFFKWYNSKIKNFLD